MALRRLWLVLYTTIEAHSIRCTGRFRFGGRDVQLYQDDKRYETHYIDDQQEVSLDNDSRTKLLLHTEAHDSGVREDAEAASHTFPLSFDNDQRFRREEKIRMPPQRLCPKGAYDSDVAACVWLDKRDKVLPSYECPPGSVLDGDFCYGRIIADYELDCPRGFLINEDEICVKAVVYTPPRNICPEGFALVNAAPEGRLKICKRVKYAAPVRRPVETIAHLETVHCTQKEWNCPKPTKPAADREWVLQCPVGTKMVRSKDGRSKACKVEVLVPPMPAESCSPGFRLIELLNFGLGCVKVTAQDPALVCPGPRPKFGPGFGTWDTPRYKYDPVDKCVAYRAKAIEGQCPFGYEWLQDTCYRKYFMPYYMDCNNLEGYGFVWDSDQQQGICEYIFDPYKWTPGTSFLTRRERLDAGRIYLLSNPFDVKKAYENSNDVAAAFRPPPATAPTLKESTPKEKK